MFTRALADVPFRNVSSMPLKLGDLIVLHGGLSLLVQSGTIAEQITVFLQDNIAKAIQFKQEGRKMEMGDFDNRGIAILRHIVKAAPRMPASPRSSGNQCFTFCQNISSRT